MAYLLAFAVGNFRANFGIIRASKLQDPHFPVPLLTNQLVDLVIEVTETMLSQARILNIHDFTSYFSDDLLSPFVSIGQVSTLRRKKRPSLLRLLLLLILGLQKPTQHGLRFLLISGHVFTKISLSLSLFPHSSSSSSPFTYCASLPLSVLLGAWCEKQRWRFETLMATPETLKLNDVLPFQKVMTIGNSSSKLLCQLFLGMVRSAT